MAKMLGRGGWFCSTGGRLGVLRLKEAKKLELRMGFEVGLLLVCPMLEVGNQRVVSLILWKEWNFYIHYYTVNCQEHMVSY